MERKSLTPNPGVLMIDYNRFVASKQVTQGNMCVKLMQLCTEPKGNTFHQLQQFRKMVPILISAYLEQFELSELAVKEIERTNALSAENKNKRWSDEEENLLIDLVVNETPIIEISTIMGRSPTAISNKVSKLVGIERISQKVAGKFFGTINGKEITGTIKGTVQK